MHTAGRYFLVYLLDHVLAVVALSAVLVLAGLALATPAQNKLLDIARMLTTRPI
jgi:hypothetical protein